MLDSNNNLVVNGDIEVLDDLDALSQDVKSMILLQVKEYIYDLNKGVDWWAFLQEGDLAKLLNEIETQIYNDSRVASVIINNSIDENNALVLEITTTEGQQVSVNVAS